MSKTQKTWIVVGAVLVVIIGVVLVFANLRVQGTGTAGSSSGTAGTSGGSGTSAYQTTTVQHGTLTSTVEGTGTVGSKPFGES